MTAVERERETETERENPEYTTSALLCSHRFGIVYPRVTAGKEFVSARG